MAASMSWRSYLNSHKLFTTLRHNLEKVKPETEAKDILTIYDGELFVWNAYNGAILTTNVKLLVGKNETETRESSFQTLLCTKPPTYDVDQLLFSPTGSYLAVIGKRGVSVVDLPKRWGKYAEFEGGKPRILCRTIPVAERYFLSSHECVLHAEWHPGSDNDMHLVLLMSDNTIRIYNLQNPQSADQTFPLGSSSVGGGDGSPNRLRLQDVLGESAISFDFGPPIEIKLKNRHRHPSTLSFEEDSMQYAWPVYILWGNGDVYVLNTAVTKIKTTLKKELHGPLSMYPPAEDNYGSEACSISCLYSRPAMLVIATSEGKLHHCVLLNVNDNDETKSETSQFTDMYGADTTSRRLYVYETVELELSLSMLNMSPDDATITDMFSCPIRMHKDSSCGDRYHCSHSAGIHTVSLPWLQKIQSFCEEIDGIDPPSLSESEHSIVEHLVCTKPLPSSPACPVLGLCMTADRLLGNNLLCLTNTHDCLVLPLTNTFKTSAPALLSASSSRTTTSPLRQLHREPFDMHIYKILNRSSSNPLIKTGSKTDMTPQQCFQLLSRATQVFREEYLQKQDLAREEIDKRVRILREHKELHVSDLQECQEKKNELRNQAENLAEKYEDAKDKQEELILRVETVLKKIQSKLPVLTEAEKNMQKDLKKMEEKLNINKTSIQQLRTKMDYQRRQISSQASSGVNPVFSKTQSQQLRTELRKEGEDITVLVKEINNLKMTLDT